MKPMDRDVRDTDSRSGLWFLLLIVIVGSTIQFAGMPSTGSTAPATIMIRETPDASRQPEPAEAPSMLEQRAEPLAAANEGAGITVASPGVAPLPEAGTRQRSSQPARASSPRSQESRAPAAAPAETAASPAAPPTRTTQEAAAPSEPVVAAARKVTGLTPVVVLPLVPSAPRAIAPAQDETPDPAEPEAPADIDDEAGDADRGRSHDPEPEDARIVVVGPAGVRPREFITFTLAAENVKGLAHAPVRLAFDAEVLEFVAGEEGSFLTSDGAQTQFMIAPGETPGTLDIALSRMAPASGIDGSGVLCSVTFLARGPGMSPIVTAGSRFLDAAARGMALRSDDAYVSVQ